MVVCQGGRNKLRAGGVDVSGVDEVAAHLQKRVIYLAPPYVGTGIDNILFF
jgi:hypothetical protein